MTDPADVLVVRRLIQAPRTRIFEAFSHRELLEQWFTPSPDVSIEVLEFDFRAEGRFRLRYIMPDGRRPVVGGAYERIERPEQITMSWIWEAPDPLEGVAMRVRFQFVDRSGATEIVVTHENSPTDMDCTIHESGWEGALGRLEAAFMNDALPLSS